PARRFQRVFPLLDDPLGDGPRPQVAPLPEGPAGVREKYLDPRGGAAIEEHARAYLVVPRHGLREHRHSASATRRERAADGTCTGGVARGRVGREPEHTRKVPRLPDGSKGAGTRWRA